MAQAKGRIYAYTTPAYRRTLWRGRRWGRGLLKVGYTTRDPHIRIREQIGASSPEKKPYELLVSAHAVTKSGARFTDKDIHRIMRGMGIRNVHNEWFEARPRDVRRALKQVGGQIARKEKKRAGRTRKRSKSPFPKTMLLISAVIFGSYAYNPIWTFAKIKMIMHFLYEQAIQLI